jgi:predicted MFS family arabinose efflux permease
VTGTLRIERLYLVGFCIGTLELFFDVSYMSFVPSLVRRDQLIQGNSMLQMSDSFAQVGGPGLGGALVQVFTAPFAILLDALSFLASAASVALIRSPERSSARDSHRGVWTEMWEGLRLVLKNPVLRGIAGCTATLNLFANALMTVYMLYATSALGLTPAVIGAVFAMGGASTVVGTVLAGPVSRRFGVGPTLIAAPVLIGLASFLIPLASGPRWLAVVLLAGAQVLFGIGRPVFDINQLSLRQAMTAERMQGRVNASMLFLIWGVIPFGFLMGGVLGTLIGLRSTLLVGAIGMSLAFTWVLFSPVRTLRRHPATSLDQAA